MLQTNDYSINWCSLLLILLITVATNGIGQTYPSFGQEKPVSIIGLTSDAMEPFISPDGNVLFFNNLNDGINTKLFYATKVNDSTFTFVGELNGTNQTIPPYLDAVADLDSLNNFYWTSTREYPIEFDNLFHGSFNEGNVTNTGRVHGDFYIYSAGWILMDHGISLDGQFLYFNNARFDGANCSGPCETRIGIAQKVNDSTFTMLNNSDGIMLNVNHPDFKNYAPCITKDNLELYYTRFPQGPIDGSTLSEICVVVRNTPVDTFSTPLVLFSDFLGSSIVEAPTLTTDKQIMYYHKKIGGVHKILMRHREILDDISNYNNNWIQLKITPNPMYDNTIIEFDNTLIKKANARLIDHLGRTVRYFNNFSAGQIQIHKDDLSPGLYIIQLYSENDLIASEKLIIK